MAIKRILPPTESAFA